MYDNIGIQRAHLLDGEDYQSKCVNKEHYFKIMLLPYDLYKTISNRRSAIPVTQSHILVWKEPNDVVQGNTLNLLRPPLQPYL
ncbi:hypothetical protein [Pontibacter sp. SGAir0037]|uniref:hypothetical protein n=1 Tax=Pontibacter sp. SGAir0037 TaxID=2571030 RepID=UPI0010F74CD5|nr:hypothetical protein [Pontibacter sp. SGAir0037]